MRANEEQGMKFRLWSEEETQRLLDLMKTHGRDFKTIGRLMGRTHQSCEHRWRWINMPADQLERRNKGEAARKAKIRNLERGAKHDLPVRKMIIPDHVIIDQQRRLSAPLTISSYVLGDPPPGFSALDRRAAQ
jgi:hypothetical protein